MAGLANGVVMLRGVSGQRFGRVSPVCADGSVIRSPAWVFSGGRDVGSGGGGNVYALRP